MFDLTPEEARLLLNVALMATGANRFQSAAAIFAVLEAFRPEAPAVAIGKTILLVSEGKFEEAVAYVDDETNRRFPGNAMLAAFKGMALQRLDRIAQANVALQQAADQVDDPAAAQLAKGLLS